MEQVDVVVVGAGVVGLACARALALAGREVLVLESADAIGTGTSSRNSEVVHAGLYYPHGSLKARHCVRGRQMLYAYCTERGIGHRRSGKLIVATQPEQIARLEAIRRFGEGNGVDDLRLLSAREAIELEPALSCSGALLSPSSGIIDSHALMLSLQGDLEAAGGQVVLLTPVRHIRVQEDASLRIETGGAEPMTLSARWVINSAGIDAPELARHMTGFPEELVPGTWYAKGNYFSLAGRAPFTRLIYPVPEQAGLGVHLTLDLAGQARFGPDVQWIPEPDYTVDPRRADSFYAEIRKYWPALPDHALQPAYAGIRPKIDPPGQDGSDFVVLGPLDHGVEGVVQLFGIESPGLTASLSLGALVAGLVTGVSDA